MLRGFGGFRGFVRFFFFFFLGRGGGGGGGRVFLGGFGFFLEGGSCVFGF